MRKTHLDPRRVAPYALSVATIQSLERGLRILDATGGLGVLNHGHNHPRIIAARKRFQEQGRMEVHKSFLSPYVGALSANIARLLPGDLNISYFPNSGAEESIHGSL